MTKPEPFWYAIVSERAPVINKAIRSLDVAEEYADKARENYPDATDIEVVALYRDVGARAGDGNLPAFTDEQIEAAVSAWFKEQIQSGRYPFAKRMRAAIGAALAAAPAALASDALPHPGSPEADQMIEALLAEYGHPENAKNAARAGYMAARRLMGWARKPLPDFQAPGDGKPADLAQRITAYLAGGGLFNPELANHDAVRDLLIECREALAAAPAAATGWRGLTEQERAAFVNEICEYGTGFVAPLFSLAESLEEVLKARNSAAAPAAAPAWQPIETAPMDGRTLLLGYFNLRNKWRTVRGQWFSQAEIDDTWEEPDTAEPGWYETVVESDDIPNCWRTYPTHWQPLPAAPGIPSPATRSVKDRT